MQLFEITVYILILRNLGSLPVGIDDIFDFFLLLSLLLLLLTVVDGWTFRLDLRRTLMMLLWLLCNVRGWCQGWECDGFTRIAASFVICTIFANKYIPRWWLLTLFKDLHHLLRWWGLFRAFSFFPTIAPWSLHWSVLLPYFFSKTVSLRRRVSALFYFLLHDSTSGLHLLGWLRLLLWNHCCHVVCRSYLSLLLSLKLRR